LAPHVNAHAAIAASDLVEVPGEGVVEHAADSDPIVDREHPRVRWIVRHQEAVAASIAVADEVGEQVQVREVECIRRIRCEALRIEGACSGCATFSSHAAMAPKMRYSVALPSKCSSSASASSQVWWTTPSR